MELGRFWRAWRRRVVAWALFLALIPVALVAIALHTAYRQVSTELIVERNRQAAHLAAGRLEDELLGFASILGYLARTPEISGGNVAEQQAALQQTGAGLAAFDAGVVLLDSFGTVRATMPERPQLLLQDWSHHRFFQELLTSSEVAFSDGVYEGPSAGMVALVGVRVLNADGQFAGALAGMFGLGKSTASSLYASIVRLRLGQTGTVYVVDGNGRVLYDSNYAQVGTIFDASGLPAQALQGIGGAARSTDAQGRSIVAAYVPIVGTGWALITQDSWASATYHTRRYLDNLLALLAGGMILPAAGATLLTRMGHAQSRELDRLEQARHVACLVQDVFIPRYLPVVSGWTLAALQHADEADCGTLYDYLFLSDGRLMLSIVEVHDPTARAAFVSATSRAVLRQAARQSLTAATALAQANDALCPELAVGSTVTCLYALLDPSSGRIEVGRGGSAHAYHLRADGTGEVGTSGPPLGQKLGVHTAHSEVTIDAGESVLLVAMKPRADVSDVPGLDAELLMSVMRHRSDGEVPRGSVQADGDDAAFAGGCTALLLTRTPTLVTGDPLQ